MNPFEKLGVCLKAAAVLAAAALALSTSPVAAQQVAGRRAEPATPALVFFTPMAAYCPVATQASLRLAMAVAAAELAAKGGATATDPRAPSYDAAFDK